MTRKEFIARRVLDVFAHGASEPTNKHIEQETRFAQNLAVRFEAAGGVFDDELVRETTLGELDTLTRKQGLLEAFDAFAVRYEAGRSTVKRQWDALKIAIGRVR